jgi:formylglycine-generating enzyme required for sulfatase activity
MAKRIWSILLIVFLFSGGSALAACPSADLSGDCFVNFEDFAVIGAQWLNVYDWNDVNTLANQWLTGIRIPNDPCNLVWVYIDDPGVDGHESFNGYMSKYETTNAQYCQFLNAALATGDITVGGDYVIGANGSNSGEDFVGEKYYYLAGPGYDYNGATNGGAARINYSAGSFTVDSGFDNHPVTHVNWYGSTAFCNYYGYRLPTEWEWQAVADYDGTYTYGCGTSISHNIANYYDSLHPDGTTVAGSFGDPSGYGYGMCDMAGNAYEWTTSLYITIQGGFVIRGGSWNHNAGFCSVSSRNGATANNFSGLAGFRVCR